MTECYEKIRKALAMGRRLWFVLMLAVVLIVVSVSKSTKPARSRP